jgi:hypothetical protein
MTPPLGSQDLTVALRVIETLEDLGISYHLGGSVASSVHGIPRQTRDIDIAVDLPVSAVAALVARLQREFYLDEERIRAAVQSLPEPGSRLTPSLPAWSSALPGKTLGKRLETRPTFLYTSAPGPHRAVNARGFDHKLRLRMVVCPQLAARCRDPEAEANRMITGRPRMIVG